MPISRFPRHGHPIAPALLAPFLDRSVPNFCLRLNELTASRCASFDEKVRRKLANRVVGYLASQVDKIERVVGNCRLSHVDTNVQLDAIELEVRTYNCLSTVDLQSLPGGLGTLTIVDVLNIRGFGIRSLVDLLTSIEAAAAECNSKVVTGASGIPGAGTTGKTIQLPLTFEDVSNEVHDECRWLLNQIRGAISIPRSALDSRVPLLPPKRTLAELPLRVRTRTVLGREGLLQDSSRLSNFTVRDLLNLRGFGIGCVVDLLDNVARTRDDTGRDSVECTISTCIDSICSAIGKADIHEKDPRFKRLIRHLSLGIAWIKELNNCRKNAVLYRRVNELQQILRAIKRCSGETIEAEIMEIAVTKTASSRNHQLLAEFYGFHGHTAATLKAIGDRHRLTRERVRQICAPSRIMRLAHPPFAPILDKVLMVIEQMVPTRQIEIEKTLRSEGLIKEGTQLNAVKRISKLLNRRFDFELVGSGTSAIVVPMLQVNLAKKSLKRPAKLCDEMVPRQSMKW